MTSQSPDPEDVPDDGEDTSSQAEPTGESGIEPMSLPATYRAFRESIVGLGTGGTPMGWFPGHWFSPSDFSPSLVPHWNHITIRIGYVREYGTKHQNRRSRCYCEV